MYISCAVGGLGDMSSMYVDEMSCHCLPVSHSAAYASRSIID
jgi:hypothetical protein